jgi:hypothetical protein
MRLRWTLFGCALAACGESPAPDASMTSDGGHDAGALVDAARSDAGSDAGPPRCGEGLEWPNEESSAASDPWIVEHHDELETMRPRVLALNFVNGQSNAQMESMIGSIATAMREATRPHGAGCPFLELEIARSVDLTDQVPPEGWPYQNSTRFPREEPRDEYWGFDYEQLFDDTFAGYYGYEDPDVPGRYLTLCELSERGLVHEVWLYASADVPDASAAELLGITPFYDGAGNRRTDLGLNRCAGNGCFDTEDQIPLSCTRTLRIGFVNYTRGVGCYMESYGHAIEGIANNGMTRPYFSRYFRELAGFDLDVRFGLARTSSWYSCGYSKTPCLTYPTPTSATFDTGEEAGSIDPYVPVCGNAHFPPNARGHYDIVNDAPVMSTCRDYRRGSDGGEDRAVPITSADWSEYGTLAPDCTGAWAVYWWQSFPNVDRRAIADDGAPMKNWWPFLFY